MLIVHMQHVYKHFSMLSIQGKILFRITCPCNVYPLITHFYIEKKKKKTGVFKTKIVGRRGGSNMYPQSMFIAKIFFFIFDSVLCPFQAFSLISRRINR